MEFLHYYFEPHVIDIILTIDPTMEEEPFDNRYWDLTPSDKFSISSMVNQLANEDFVRVGLSTVMVNQQILWKWCGPPQLCSFLWLATHGKLFTNQKHYKCHLSTDGFCYHYVLNNDTT